MSVYMTNRTLESDQLSSYVLLFKGYFSIGILALPFIFN